MRTVEQDADAENPVSDIDFDGTSASVHFDRLWTALGLGNHDAGPRFLDGEFDFSSNRFANVDRFSLPASERQALDPFHSISDDDQNNSSALTFAGLRNDNEDDGSLGDGHGCAKSTPPGVAHSTEKTFGEPGGPTDTRFPRWNPRLVRSDQLPVPTTVSTTRTT
jgi:hypothetical protein